MAQGGKRPGAGRPAGTTKDDNKIQIAARVSPEVAAWLSQFRNKSAVVEKALLFVMKKAMAEKAKRAQAEAQEESR